MPVVLSRVDDRLIHGQVVLGWGRPLAARRIVLVDDAVAGAPWEQDIYRMAAPMGVSIAFATLADAVAELPAWDAATERTILLTGDLATMAALQHAHPALLTRINLGGIHHRAGRAERLSYLFLDAHERQLIDEMQGRGATVVAQDLPTSVGIDASELP
jgi:PTS system mannose-specific IIB component/fructoselysine and glucoselysine-specific PTS system IIB component